MRLIKTIIAVVILSAILSSTGAESVDPNNLAAYYGFNEMEIIKLDWGIRGLRIADFNGDGKNDLVTVIHDRIIIYPQD